MSKSAMTLGEIADAVAKMAMERIREEIRAMIREELSRERNTSDKNQ